MKHLKQLERFRIWAKLTKQEKVDLIKQVQKRRVTSDSTDSR